MGKWFPPPSSWKTQQRNLSNVLMLVIWYLHLKMLPTIPNDTLRNKIVGATM